jgi:hypothetical protein
MTEREFLEIVLSVRRVGGPEILDRSLEDVPLDSWDLLELGRRLLKPGWTATLTEEKFRASSTLRDCIYSESMTQTTIGMPQNRRLGTIRETGSSAIAEISTGNVLAPHGVFTRRPTA